MYRGMDCNAIHYANCHTNMGVKFIMQCRSLLSLMKVPGKYTNTQRKNLLQKDSSINKQETAFPYNLTFQSITPAQTQNFTKHHAKIRRFHK